MSYREHMRETMTLDLTDLPVPERRSPIREAIADGWRAVYQDHPVLPTIIIMVRHREEAPGG